MLTIHLTSQVEIARDDLPQAVEAELIRKSTHKDPLYKLQQNKGRSTAGLTPKIETYSISDDTDTIRFWRGSLGVVVKVLRRHKVDYQMQDDRLRLPRIELPTHDLILRDYQEPAFAVMRKRQQTLFRGEAGSGKTETMLAAVAHFKQPTLVLVWQERQQNVWLKRIPKYFDCEVGGVGGQFKKPVYAPITVAMVQSVRNRMEEIAPLFGCVLCDEVQRFAANTLSEVVNNLPAAIRIGASDDERRRDGREFMLYSTFGPKGYELAKGAGQCPVDVIAVPTRFTYYQRGWNINWQDLTESFGLDRERNALVVNLATREAREGKRIVIWSDRVEHCEELQLLLQKRGVQAGLLLGTKERKEEADATEAGLVDGTISVGIGTVVAEQSINIPPLTVGIMTCASADKKMYRFRQMRGRLARLLPGDPNKRATIYYLWDKQVSFLRGKVNNLKRAGYRFKISRFDKRRKETERMADKAVVTLDTMKAGAKALRLKVPKGATFKKMEQLIQRALAKDKTFGSYACEQCGRDIIDEIPICPYCRGEFKPVAEAEPDEEEFAGEEETEEPEDEGFGEEEPEEEGDDGFGEEEGEEEEGEPEEEGEGEYEEEEGEEEEGEPEEGEEEEGEPEEGEDDGFGEEEEEDIFGEEEEPEPAKPAKKVAKKKATKKAPAKKPAAKKPTAAEALKEKRRAQIRKELPFKKAQLLKMKRPALVMIASELGVKNPVSLGDNAAIITSIGRAQAKEFGKPGAPKKAPAKKAPAKKAPAKKAPAKKTTKKKTTRRRA